MVEPTDDGPEGEALPPVPDSFPLARDREEAGAGPGRPSKLELMSDADKAKLIRALRAGTPAKYACASVGITRRTLDNWRKRADAGESPYTQFVDEVERAEGQYVVETMTIIDVDGKGLPAGFVGEGPTRVPRERGDWKALAWKLEKLHPRDFAPLQKQEHSGPEGGPIPGARLVYLPQKDPIPEPPEQPLEDADT